MCKHVFLVSGWISVVGGNQARTFTCRHCLVSVGNTPDDIEKMRQSDGAANEHDIKAVAKPARKAASNKTN